MRKASRRKLLIGAGMFMLVAVSMISSVSAISKKDAIMGFVNGCFNPTEGYYGTNDNSTAKETTMESTFAAMNIISILAPPLSDRLKVGTGNLNAPLQFIITATLNNSGGFRSIPGVKETVMATYKGVYFSKLIGFKNETALMNSHVQFVLKSQNVNGGFGSSPSTNSTPDIFNTYYALKVLQLTGNLTNIKYNMTLVRNFTLSCRRAGSVFAGTWNSTDVSIAATYFAVRLYRDFLSSWHDLDGTAGNVSAFLASHQHASGGFIDPAVSTEPLLSSTFYAVSICREFVSTINIPLGDDRTINWILSRQSYTGGFIEGNSPVATASMVATDFAVSAINKIRPSLSDLYRDTDWTLSQIAGTVAAVILIIAIIALIFVAYVVKRRNRI
ncbi:MAG: prenyltransferase/squalene oxidase repeat-containing protein [Candidatus Sigynarchaeum springense]